MLQKFAILLIFSDNEPEGPYYCTTFRTSNALLENKKIKHKTWHEIQVVFFFVHGVI